MTKIKLHGKLAEAIGRDAWELKVSSVSEALHAINVQSADGIKKFFLQRENAYSRYEVIVDGESLTTSDDVNNNDLVINRHEIDSIEIVPVLQGAFIGLLGIALGAASLITATSSMAAMVGIMLIAQGISNLLSKPPEMPEQRQIQNPSSDPTQLANSYLFNGPVNVLNEGGPVPIGYGRLIVGSQVVMSSYGVKKVLVREAGRVR